MKEGSVDDALFWAMSHNAPEGSIKDQANWTVDAVKRHKATIVAPFVESAKKAKKAQEANAPLERAGPGKEVDKKKPPDKPMSLHAAFKGAERRV